MEDFVLYVNQLLKYDDARIVPRNSFYGFISHITENILDREKFKEILPKIYELFQGGKIKKEAVFISLLLNRPVLDLFLNYEREINKLNINDPVSILNYTYFNNKHWFNELLEDLETHAQNFSINIQSILNVLKIVLLTHSHEIDLEELNKYLNNLSTNDTLLSAYVANVKQRYETVKFICKVQTSACESDAFMLSNEMNFLETFSHYMNLSDINIWPEILSRLEENQTFNKLYYKSKHTINELEIFTSFTVLLNVIHSMDVCKNFNNNDRKFKEELNFLMDMCKTKILHMKDHNLQIGLLEDIFTLVFARNDHFPITAFKQKEFYCSDQVIRLILSFLKNIIDDLRKTYTNKKCEESGKFAELQKIVTDAYWRYELVTDVRSHKEDPNAIIKFMLSTPEALINLCLKQDDIDRANQVIQVFNLRKTHLAYEINYCRDIAILKRDIRNIDKSDVPTGQANLELKNAIQRHMISCEKKLLELQGCGTPTSLIQCPTETQVEYQKDVDLLDVLVNLPMKYSSYKFITSQLHDTFSSNLTALTKFYDRVQDVTEDTYIEADKLFSSYSTYDAKKYFNNVKQYNKLIEAYDKFKEGMTNNTDGTLNISHELNEKILKIQDICIAFGANEKREHTQYIQKLLKYLQSFAKILFSESDNSDLISKGKDVSVLEILKHKKPDLICSLLYQRNLDGADFDNIFCKLKLDLTYHISYSSFPNITFDVYNNINFSENLNLQKPRHDVINYVQKRSWFLAFLINKIHGLKDTKVERNEVRIKVFTNLMNLPDIQKLKKLFNNNETLTVLHQDYCFSLKNYFDNLMLTADTSARFNEGYMKLDLPQDTTWKSLYKLVLTIPEKDLKENDDIYNLRDILLCNLIKERTEKHYYKYVRYISDYELRMRIILEELQYWPGDFCVDVLKAEISNCEHQKDIEKLMLRYKQVELYMKVKQLCDYSSWFEVDKLCTEYPEVVMLSILATTDMEVLMNYFFLHPPHEELLLNITEHHLLAYFTKYPFYKIQLVLNVLPKKHCIDTCMKLFSLLRNLTNLNFVVNYLLNINGFDVNLKNIQISSRILQNFSHDEVHQFWLLIDNPLSILEMLLMNIRLEKFEEVYNDIIPELGVTEFNDKVISVEKIDELLRIYAEKSLEFKVIGYSPSRWSLESDLMMTIDSLGLDPDKFEMPDNVPDKSKWIKDSEVLECMSCRSTKFSMFNRRHHCRRCGRVVCWSCSLKKMKIDTYGDILVRVCNDCFAQSNVQDAPRCNFRSITDEYWTLTGDNENDSLVREEFAYDNAPNVMLSIAILKFHSKTEDHPKFLLQQCENILKILRPQGENRSQEIDYTLLIQMLKMLVMSAKMVSSDCIEWWSNKGAAMADTIASQAEVLGVLADHGYLHLLPSPSRLQSVHVDANTLRCVRDKLVEDEQWSLALEISTKAELDTTGVFAMWGKSFLQAGDLLLARKKFKICFDRIMNTSHNTSDPQNFLKNFRTMYRGYSLDHKKSDPLLLTEIMQILESKIDRINPKLYKEVPALANIHESTSTISNQSCTAAHSENAICIMNNLIALEAIEQGIYAPVKMSPENSTGFKPYLENIFYDECIYYLTEYGCPESLCQFYVRQKEFREALEYIYKKKVSADILTEIYINCLKHGQIEPLHDAMIDIDPTLDMWTEYIKSLCLYMDKHGMMHSLYELQQFVGDYVRAALMCIKFYSSGINTFLELTTRTRYLFKAQKHLKQVQEQDQWVDVTSVKISSCSFLEEKPLGNPSLVMKLNHRQLNIHINSIDRQIDIVKYLAEREEVGHPVTTYIPHIQPLTDATAITAGFELPTLFGTTHEKVQLAVLIIISSDVIPNGFKVALQMIKDFKIKPGKVYSFAGKLLAQSKRLDSITELVMCVLTSGNPEAGELCDEMLIVAARTLATHGATDEELEDIIKFIANHNTKIDTYVDTRQLRSGFLLAAKHNKTYDVMRIIREAELYNRPDVIVLCERYLEEISKPRQVNTENQSENDSAI